MLRRTSYKDRIYIASIYNLIEFTKSLPLHDLSINGEKAYDNRVWIKYFHYR